MKYALTMILLFAILAALKVFGGVAMSWWLVATPLIVLGAVTLIVFVIALVIIGTASRSVKGRRDTVIDQFSKLN